MENCSSNVQTQVAVPKKKQTVNELANQNFSYDFDSSKNGNDKKDGQMMKNSEQNNQQINKDQYNINKIITQPQKYLNSQNVQKIDQIDVNLEIIQQGYKNDKGDYMNQINESQVVQIITKKTLIQQRNVKQPQNQNNKVAQNLINNNETKIIYHRNKQKQREVLQSSFSNISSYVTSQLQSSTEKKMKFGHGHMQQANKQYNEKNKMKQHHQLFSYELLQTDKSEQQSQLQNNTLNIQNSQLKEQISQEKIHEKILKLLEMNQIFKMQNQHRTQYNPQKIDNQEQVQYQQSIYVGNNEVQPKQSDVILYQQGRVKRNLRQFLIV